MGFNLIRGITNWVFVLLIPILTPVVVVVAGVLISALSVLVGFGIVLYLVNELRSGELNYKYVSRGRLWFWQLENEPRIRELKKKDDYAKQLKIIRMMAYEKTDFEVRVLH